MKKLGTISHCIIHSRIACLLVQIFRLFFFFSPTAIVTNCEAGVDLFFAIDSTATLGQNGHAAMRRMAVDLVDKFAIGTKNDNNLDGLTRVDVIQFWGQSASIRNPNSQATVDIKLGNYADKNDLEQKIETLEYRGGLSTIIPRGLATLNEEIDKHYDQARDMYALVLTDGVDDSRPSNLGNLGTLKQEADKIKAKSNVQVFAIGFEQYNKANLETIASPGNVITAEDVGAALNITYNRLITLLCPNMNIRLLPTPPGGLIIKCGIIKVISQALIT